MFVQEKNISVVNKKNYYKKYVKKNTFGNNTDSGFEKIVFVLNLHISFSIKKTNHEKRK